LQQKTQRAAFGQIYPHRQLLHRSASKIFRNGRRRSRQLRRNFRNFAENLQSCRGSFAAGSRRNFAPKYATWSIWPDLPAPLAFAPPRVAKFSKRSPKKSTASPKFPKICRKLAILPGLVLGWMEAKFCTKIRNVQLLPRSTRSPSFCTGPRRKFFETVREEVASVAEISKNF
jgi:hypothetical protein